MVVFWKVASPSYQDQSKPFQLKTHYNNRNHNTCAYCDEIKTHFKNKDKVN